MPELVMLAAAALTSLAAYALVRRRAMLSLAGFREAVQRTLECVGASVVFLLLNLLIEAALVLALRRLTGQFVSLYFAGDGMIIPISCLQGLTACWWMSVSRRAG
jgi:hypothetical protein